MVLAAAALDFFVAPGIAPGFGLYAGFFAAILLIRKERYHEAAALAAAYGIVADMLNPVLPFGTMLFAHGAAYAALVAARRSIAGSDMRRLALASLVLLFVYGVYISLVEHLSLALFGAIRPDTGSFIFWDAAAGAAATTALALAGLKASAILAARAGHLFFSTRR